MRSFRKMMLAAAFLLAARAHADPVTEWTALADQAGSGAADWRTLAIMHQAMHDAWNAALPTYQRWFPPAPDEPRPGDTLPQAAIAAAARRVLLELHPDYTGVIELLFRHAMARLPNRRAEQDGAALGDAIGIAAVRRPAGDGYERRHLFVKHSATGEWRPAPLEFATSGTTETRPFLFANANQVPSVPPSAPGSQGTVASLGVRRRLPLACIEPAVVIFGLGSVQVSCESPLLGCGAS
jgi:hypothetical protein